MTATPARALPALGESDAEFGAALAALFGAPAFQQMFEEPLRLASLRDLPPVHGRVTILPLHGGLEAFAPRRRTALSIAPTTPRYTPYGALESVDSRKLSATYAQFYLLFQQALPSRGPNRYFNDRVFEDRSSARDARHWVPSR